MYPQLSLRMPRWIRDRDTHAVNDCTVHCRAILNTWMVGASTNALCHSPWWYNGCAREVTRQKENVHAWAHPALIIVSEYQSMNKHQRVGPASLHNDSMRMRYANIVLKVTLDPRRQNNILNYPDLFCNKKEICNSKSIFKKDIFPALPLPNLLT